jgi:D-sedoheptulose 7-phosphate isomerase
VLVAGNGGSAAEAQHFAAELVGRFKRERDPYAVLSLTTDTSILTAVANDYGYAEVFARQVRGFGECGDLLLLFSTSGESENLVRAAIAAQQCLMSVAAITCDRSSRLEHIANVTVRVPVVDTAFVQELHMVVTHILCDIAESELAQCEGLPWSEQEKELPGRPDECEALAANERRWSGGKEPGKTDRCQRVPGLQRVLWSKQAPGITNDDRYQNPIGPETHVL